MSRDPFEGVRRLFRIRGVQRDLDDELAFHLEETVADLCARGWSEAAARAEAQRRFGDERHWRREMERIDRSAEARRRWMDVLQSFAESVRYAVRGMRRAPGFTAGVVLTFALGIGANATMFGILDRILLRPPEHVVDHESVRRIAVNTLNRNTGERGPSEYLAYLDVQDFTQAGAFAKVAAYGGRELTVGRGLEAQRLETRLVTGEFFPLLGVRPALGRLFTPAETRLGGPRIAVIGHELWRRQYGSDPSAIGRTIDFGQGPWEIVGVAPKGFTGADLERVDLWLPLEQAQEALTGGTYWRESRRWWWLRSVARLAPGVDLQEAQTEATLLHRQGRHDEIAGGDYDATVQVLATPLIVARGPDASEESVVAKWLAGVSLLVLLIACANVANLLLARSLRRRREIGIRLALGISRRRLIGQLVTESLVLAVIGGVAAVLATHWSAALVSRVLLPEIYWGDTVVGPRIATFAVVLAVLAGLVAGLIPAVQASRPDVLEALKSGARTIAGAGTRTRGVLTVVQAALSVVLLVGAGLFVRSLDRVQSLDLGMDPEPVLLAMPIFDSKLTVAEQHAFFERALERIRAIPAVSSAGVSVGLPFWSGYSFTLEIPGLDSVPRLSTGSPAFHATDPEWFAAMGLEIVRGRGFTDADWNNPWVALVNRTMAETVWPGEDAIGQCLLTDTDSQDDIEPPCAEVIGVVENARGWNIVEEPSMQYYVPLTPEVVRNNGPETMLIRARDDDPAALIPVVQRELLDIDARLRYMKVMRYQERFDPQSRSWKLGATMFSVFGILALLVAAIGLHSLLAFSVAQRTHEFGIRAALGARRERILGLVVGQGMRLVVAGVALGLVLALLAAPRLETLLFQTSPRDPVVLVLVAAALLVVAALSCAIPAWRATRVDPQKALRSE